MTGCGFMGTSFWPNEVWSSYPLDTRSSAWHRIDLPLSSCILEVVKIRFTYGLP